MSGLPKTIIIALAGRKGCGKSELSKICAKQGFVVLSFADSLKDLICKLLGITRDKLNEIKESDFSYSCNQEGARIISEATGIDVRDVSALMVGKIFNKPREMLQFVGTEIIREKCPRWHVEKMASRILSGGKYCIDDLRFPDEKQFLDSVGALCFYIIRPSNFSISNHPSEVSLKWVNFDEVIINNQRLNTFRRKWDLFIESISDPKLGKKHMEERFVDKFGLRRWLKEEVKNKTVDQIAKELDCSRDKILWWCNKLLVRKSQETYEYNNRAFLCPTPIDSYVAGLLCSDGCVKTSQNGRNITISFTSTDKCLAEIVQKTFGTKRPIYERITRNGYSSGTQSYDIDCQNYFIIENLKHWNIKPRKSTIEETPDIILNDENAIKHWIVGMIDGDGSVFVTERGGLTIIALGSKEVIDFIYKSCPFEATIRPHKDTALFDIRWSGYCAVDMAEWLGDAVTNFGLKRKWRAIKEYKENPRRGRRIKPSCFKNENSSSRGMGRYKAFREIIFEDRRPSIVVRGILDYCRNNDIDYYMLCHFSKSDRFYKGVKYKIKTDV